MQSSADKHFCHREKRRLLLLKDQFSRHLIDNSGEETSCGYVANLYWKHKKTLKRLEKVLIKKGVNTDISNFTITNGRQINCNRYITNLQNLCKSFSTFLSTVKFSAEKTNLSAALEAVYLHLETIEILEELINYVPETSTNQSGQCQSSGSVSSSQRDGESGRTSENQISGPLLSQF